MPRLHLIFSNFKRIYVAVPQALQRSIIVLLILMPLLALVELVSIMALTAFFSVLNAPEHFVASSPARLVVDCLPGLSETFSDHRRLILWACLLPIILILVKNIFAAVVNWRSALLSTQLSAFMGSGIMQRFLLMPYSWHLTAESSQTVTAFQWRIQLGQMLLQILMACSNLFTVALLFMGLMLYAPAVTMSALAFMLMIAGATYALLRPRIDEAGRETADAQQKVSRLSLTAINAVRELTIYQQQGAFLQDIAHHLQKSIRLSCLLYVSPAIPTWTLESAGFFLIWLSTFLLVHVQNAGLHEISTTIALLALTAWRVLPALNKVVGAIVSIRALQAPALSCLEYYEKLAPVPAEPVEVADSSFHIQEGIRFEHVSYRYPDTERNALTDISCTIPTGSTVGLLGRSGAGKSTFINIFCGLLEPANGRLLVDGQPMPAAQLAAYRRQVGYIPQTPYLLNGSIAQNVAFCDWGKDIDTARVQQACQEAAIDFLGPDCADIERHISPSGSGLSGGQMQRVCIARALYAAPAVLIFDEATSALDQAAEAEVQQAILRSRGKRTNIIAAHRLSTLEICDTVLWLEDGRLRETGPAKDVIQRYCAAMGVSA